MNDKHTQRLSKSVSRRTVLSSISAVALGSVVAPSASAQSEVTDEYQNLISSVTLTPRPDGETDGTGMFSLNGSWDFVLAPEGSPPHDTDWGGADVPGQWGYDGFEILEDPSEWYPPEGQNGWYRREFELSDAWNWNEGRVKLRFGAVYSRAAVWLNGTRLGEHVGGYTPFEFDVTDELSANEKNVLTVSVSQRSSADDISWQNVTGGITRDVTLFVVPETYLSKFDIDTEIHDDGQATVRVHATVTNAGTASEDGTMIRSTLTGPDGERSEMAERALGRLTAGETTETTLEIAVSNPKTWNPEQPRLYDLTCDLFTSNGQERVTERVGIRDIEVNGNQLLLNNTPLTLRGVNWEEIHLPEYGHAVPAEITRTDAERLRAANVNYVRTAHHPTSEAFVEACDELGIVVEIEAPHMFVGRDRPDPERTVVLQQTLEMIQRDRNRPSVCIWSLANESEWYDVFADAAHLMTAVDPTRPTIFNHDVYHESDPWHEAFDISSHHYPAFRIDSTVGMFDDLDAPLLFDEYAHTYCYNDREIVTDPGLRDQWVRLFARIWEQCRASEVCAGAAVWAGGDHLERWGEYRWGLVDRYRRPRPEYWHVKKTYAPVQLTSTEWIRGGHAVRVELENRSEFVNLSERSITYQSGDESGTLDLDVAPGETTTVMIPASGDVEISVRHPQGFTINSFSIDRNDGIQDGSMTPRGGNTRTTTDEVQIRSGNRLLAVDRDTGWIHLARRGTDALVIEGLELAVTPIPQWTGREYAAIVDHRLAGRTVTDVRVTNGTPGIAIGVSYATTEGEFVVRPLTDGLRIEYDFILREPQPVREVGIALPLSPDHQTLSWIRDGYWSTYPESHIGRRSGTAAAFPDSERPTDDEMRLSPDREWRHDTTMRGSNDFRSTKRNTRIAELTTADGTGIEVCSDGTQHIRCQVREETVDLLVLNRSIAGTTPDWMNRYPILDQTPLLEAGTRLHGSVTIFRATESRDRGRGRDTQRSNGRETTHR